MANVLLADPASHDHAAFFLETALRYQPAFAEARQRLHAIRCRQRFMD
jgi:hypothetical protein